MALRNRCQGGAEGSTTHHTAEAQGVSNDHSQSWILGCQWHKWVLDLVFLNSTQNISYRPQAAGLCHAGWEMQVLEFIQTWPDSHTRWFGLHSEASLAVRWNSQIWIILTTGLNDCVSALGYGPTKSTLTIVRKVELGTYAEKSACCLGFH